MGSEIPSKYSKLKSISHQNQSDREVKTNWKNSLLSPKVLQKFDVGLTTKEHYGHGIKGYLKCPVEEVQVREMTREVRFCFEQLRKWLAIFSSTFSLIE